VVKLDWREA
jgi:hypothetical protein